MEKGCDKNPCGKCGGFRTTHDVMHGHAKLRSLFRRAIAIQVMPVTPLPKPVRWFPAKRYGWGWGSPICWEGRAVTLIYLIIMFSGARFAETSPHLMILMIGAAVMCLLFFCVWKGEKPRWHWGDKKRVIPMD